MRLIFLGAPGSGKGTLAKLLSEQYHVPHISTGDIFRKEVSEGTTLGLKIKDGLGKGMLVEDGDTISLMRKRITEEDCKHGFILDGFPRTMNQAVEFDKMIKALDKTIDVVVNLNLDEEFIIKRTIGRRNCPSCGRGYNIVSESMKPKIQPFCDDCPTTSLVTRKDDNEEVIRSRQQVYKDQTLCLVSYYDQQGLLENVDASGEIDEVLHKVDGALIHWCG